MIGPTVESSHQMGYRKKNIDPRPGIGSLRSPILGFPYNPQKQKGSVYTITKHL